MTYEYQAGEVPVPAQQCVRCGRMLERDPGNGGRTVGWFQVSALSSTIWVFQSRGEPPASAAERWRCPGCERRYAFQPR